MSEHCVSLRWTSLANWQARTAAGRTLSDIRALCLAGVDKPRASQPRPAPKRLGLGGACGWSASQSTSASGPAGRRSMVSPIVTAHCA